MPDHEVRCIYYADAGPNNTDRTLTLAAERAEALGIAHIVVASRSGETGSRAAQRFSGRRVVVVTYHTGFEVPNQQLLLPEYRASIEAAGAIICTGPHAFGGVGRAVRRKLGTYQLDEIAAFTLRNLGEGIKVACEITMMATDAGLVPAGQEVIAIGGTGSGADTAVVLRAANTQDFFDLRVLELLCKPRLANPPSPE
ncbi:MAG: pyruvate kinase alpha/beta domain-containing protein [Anaerolineae bacterium]